MWMGTLFRVLNVSNATPLAKLVMEQLQQIVWPAEIHTTLNLQIIRAFAMWMDTTSQGPSVSNATLLANHAMT